MRVEFFLDYRSPYTYLANTQMPTLGAAVDYKPIDILNVMRMVNNQPSPVCPPKSRYAGYDAARWARHYGVAYAPNKALFKAMGTGQLEGALLVRAALAAQELGAFERVSGALFRAVWAGTDDLASDDGRAAFAAAHGVDELWRLAADQVIADRLAAQDREAANRGVFGVPTLFVGTEMFFGNDRLDFVKATLNGPTMEGNAA